MLGGRTTGAPIGALAEAEEPTLEVGPGGRTLHGRASFGMQDMEEEPTSLGGVVVGKGAVNSNLQLGNHSIGMARTSMTGAVNLEHRSSTVGWRGG